MRLNLRPLPLLRSLGKLFPRHTAIGRFVVTGPFFCLGRWTAMCLLGDLAKKPSNTSLDNVWTAPIPICVASPLQSSVHDIPWCYGCSEEEKIRKNRKQKKELTEFAPSNIFVTGHVAYQFWETTVVLCHFGPKKWAPHSTATRALDLR